MNKIMDRYLLVYVSALIVNLFAYFIIKNRAFDGGGAMISINGLVVDPGFLMISVGFVYFLVWWVLAKFLSERLVLRVLLDVISGVVVAISFIFLGIVASGFCMHSCGGAYDNIEILSPWVLFGLVIFDLFKTIFHALTRR